MSARVRHATFVAAFALCGLASAEEVAPDAEAVAERLSLIEAEASTCADDPMLAFLYYLRSGEFDGHRALMSGTVQSVHAACPDEFLAIYAAESPEDQRAIAEAYFGETGELGAIRAVLTHQEEGLGISLNPPVGGFVQPIEERRDQLARAERAAITCQRDDVLWLLEMTAAGDVADLVHDASLALQRTFLSCPEPFMRAFRHIGPESKILVSGGYFREATPIPGVIPTFQRIHAEVRSSRFLITEYFGEYLPVEEPEAAPEP